jgi:Holliday junction DNA helicase RuvA
MIGRLTGVVLECRPDHVVLDVGGVGYHLHIPLSTYYHLCETDGAGVALFVHTHVREDALQLYGFANPDERSTFELLIGISGVGPRLALAFLSGIGVDELHETVRREDRARLQKIPGVGKKTAERVLLELRDRLGRESRAGRVGPGIASGDPAAAPEAGRIDLQEDAVSALVNLGYTRDVSARAVNGAFEGTSAGVSLEELLKRALARLSR